tara:strand:- start:265 stop:477 length:213 start_codon:yes stop_codon:yes gene_type:complete
VPKPENVEHDLGPNSSPLSSPFAKLIIGGIVLSFGIGVVFFLTIAQQRSGELIPIDAAPNYYMHDAGQPG